VVSRRLSDLLRHLFVYGVGDVATQIVSFLLLPLYVRYLSPEDYGVLSLLLTTEVVWKILFRWGLDGAFMRLYYECRDTAAERRLASTQALFLLVVNGGLLALALLLVPFAGPHLFKTSQYNLTLALVLGNTFVTGFHYLPFHVMRIKGQAGRFMAYGVSRSVATLLLRLVLVIGFQLGVLGVVLADVVVTAGLTLALLPRFVALLRVVFSKTLLRESLSFGLPRIPHGIAHQVIAVFDRYWLGQHVTLHELGLYSTGATFGLGLKLFLSAFETAWAPFYFGVMDDADARAIYRRVTTYGVAILVLLTAGLSAVANDLIRLMTPSPFHPAAAVVPWVALGVSFQGLYLLTSIGLNITKHTEMYPVATGIAALFSVAGNVLLIPRFGIIGAAVSNSIAYAVLAFSAYRLSQRFYPVTYETRRLALLIAAGVSAWTIATVAIPDNWSHLAGLLARGSVVVLVYGGILAASGFFVPGELAALRALTGRLRGRRVVESPTEAEEFAGELVSAPTTDEAELVEERSR
jgi:O-antigen/teichoic acid export membrane protein